MHYTLEKLTHQKLQELFPGTPNWCGITIKGKHHTYAELRAQVLKEQDRKGTSNLRKSNHIEEMKRVLELEFPGQMFLSIKHNQTFTLTVQSVILSVRLRPRIALVSCTKKRHLTRCKPLRKCKAFHLLQNVTFYSTTSIKKL